MPHFAPSKISLCSGGGQFSENLRAPQEIFRKYNVSAFSLCWLKRASAELLVIFEVGFLFQQKIPKFQFVNCFQCSHVQKLEWTQCWNVLQLFSHYNEPILLSYQLRESWISSLDWNLEPHTLVLNLDSSQTKGMCIFFFKWWERLHSPNHWPFSHRSTVLSTWKKKIPWRTISICLYFTREETLQEV